MMIKKRKRGRPYKAAKERKNSDIHIRIHPDVKKALEKTAIRQNMKLSDYIRFLLTSSTNE